mmetsp:Transcript_27631/g.79752  ORF Transcript_27631/g.79752 Transcript_27631/m.79752 type:complete len:214 (+) Transcript_27631:958-1599(+)
MIRRSSHAGAAVIDGQSKISPPIDNSAAAATTPIIGVCIFSSVSISLLLPTNTSQGQIRNIHRRHTNGTALAASPAPLGQAQPERIGYGILHPRHFFLHHQPQLYPLPVGIVPTTTAMTTSILILAIIGVVGRRPVPPLMQPDGKQRPVAVPPLRRGPDGVGIAPDRRGPVDVTVTAAGAAPPLSSSAVVGLGPVVGDVEIVHALHGALVVDR